MFCSIGVRTEYSAVVPIPAVNVSAESARVISMRHDLELTDKQAKGSYPFPIPGPIEGVIHIMRWMRVEKDTAIGGCLTSFDYETIIGGDQVD